MAIGGGVADVVFVRASDVGKTSFENVGDVLRVVERERRLRGERERSAVGGEIAGIFFCFYQGDGGGERGGDSVGVELSHRSCDFGVVSVSDEQGVVSVLVEAFYLAVHL